MPCRECILRVVTKSIILGGAIAVPLLFRFPMNSSKIVVSQPVGLLIVQLSQTILLEGCKSNEEQIGHLIVLEEFIDLQAIESLSIFIRKWLHKISIVGHRERLRLQYEEYCLFRLFAEGV